MSGLVPHADRLSDTQRRFLLAVMERLPVERVHEVYLFAPMKQGGVETGIAVIAVWNVDAVDAGVSGWGAERHVERAMARPDGGPDRFTVHTASYRLQLKGPDRGRWTVEVVEEADAPLVTVDAVVRGVHRRSGEPHEVERIPAAELAGVLDGWRWTSAS